MRHTVWQDDGEAIRGVEVGKGVQRTAARMGVPKRAKDMKASDFYQSDYNLSVIEPILAAAERQGWGRKNPIVTVSLNSI